MRDRDDEGKGWVKIYRGKVEGWRECWGGGVLLLLYYDWRLSGGGRG